MVAGMTPADLEKLRTVAAELVHLRNALSPALRHILPGGALYQNLHLGGDERVRAALERFRKAARATLSRPGRRQDLAATLFGYLR
jgi:hypothetical protein